MCSGFVAFQVHPISLWALQLYAPSIFFEKYVGNNLLLQITLNLFLQGRLALLVTCRAVILILNQALKLNNMAMMTELFYEGMEPAWSYSAYHDYTDHNHRHELDPRYTQYYITRDMKPPINIECCTKCEYRLREALRNIPGVDSVVSAHNNKKLVVTGSADYNTIHYALKHIRKHHHHYLRQKLHNPFRLLLPRHSHSRYTPSWNHTSSAAGPQTSRAHNYYENDDTYNSKYGHGYGQAAEHRYRPGSLRQILFDSRRSSHHNHSGYTHH